MKRIGYTLPGSLFRFRPISVLRSAGALDRTPEFDSEILGSLASLLLHGVIYIPSVTELNGSLESPPLLDAPERLAFRHLASLIARGRKGVAEAGFWGGQRSEGKMVEGRHRGSDYYIDSFLERHGSLVRSRQVLCLAERADSALMWSHHASGHRGYVIEFDTEKRPFRDAQPVVYSTERPVLDEACIRSPMRSVANVLLTKAKEWQYEREWRILGSSGYSPFDWCEARPASPLLGCYAQLPHGSVRRIIIGACAERGVISRIRQLAAESYPSVAVSCCEIKTGPLRILVPRS